MGKNTRKILIIEDNADSAEPLKLLLEFENHIVRLASDGASGIRETAEFMPEVVICDIGLPGDLSGYEVAKEIKENALLKDTFLIALSGFGTKADKEKSKSSGFDTHLVKPPDFDVLLNLVESLSVE